MSDILLQFDPFSSNIDATFWMELARRKMNIYKLSDATIPVAGSYEFCHRSPDPSPSRLSMTSSSFDQLETRDDKSILVSGIVKNVNTFEEFKNLDKIDFLNTSSNEILDSIRSKRSLYGPNSLAKFSLLTFADLKKYRFYYWAAFPVILPPSPFKLESPAQNIVSLYSEDTQRKLTERILAFGNEHIVFWARQTLQESFECTHFQNYHEFSQKTTEWKHDSLVLVYLDPSSRKGNPGWSLRNVLLAIAIHFQIPNVRVISFRLDPKSLECNSSLVLDVILPSVSDDFVPSFTGWEMGPKGKPSPRVLDLSPILDPKQLSETAVDLNLKLMRWRILPSIDLEKISSTKCLLLGAGTLGCYVSRVLMGWGVRHISFVDYGRVSYSNPVRQPLFGIQDCLQGGKPKAETAAEALKTIFPAIHAEGHSFSIPMPGHYESPETLKENVEKLTRLIKEHDVVFLLMDSRESRWLPSVLAASMSKAVMTAALGFDTFVVMRHGIKLSEGKMNLGCYFCNDVVAPVDSMKDRTLDQQCTVSRPGLSAIASSIAVELMVNTLSHPDGFRADVCTDDQLSGLGNLPHQLRGFLGQFQNVPVVGKPFDKCVACSRSVLEAFERDGFDFIGKVIEDPKYLETITGLKQLHEDASAVEVDWDDEAEME